MADDEKGLGQLLALMFQAHPWHGIPPGEDAPAVVNAYIEIVPTDAVKYELDKASGHLRIDRPQRFSSFPPTLYGFIPQTFCGNRVGELCRKYMSGDRAIRGDGDPMDICVLTERPAAHANFLVRAKPIGGLRMVDGDEADDKIIAVLENDVAYGYINDINEAPRGVVERLQHYFLTYKQLPQESPRRVEIADVYDRDAALETIGRSIDDYRALYGAPESRLSDLRRLLSG
ncbi:MAG: inorganic pyrophosphatase [Acidobacteriota bacterium]|jgi:inorganic pyrophosphatase|nr:inorganic pyrophosphatase [Acidobacteriota bacterium]MDT7809829.1 inorganic pyrophosphatase [Acidobacteriota bacterium]